jgi:hypothetical protein
MLFLAVVQAVFFEAMSKQASWLERFWPFYQGYAARRFEVE